MRCHAVRRVIKVPVFGCVEREGEAPQRLTLRVTALYAANRVAEPLCIPAHSGDDHTTRSRRRPAAERDVD